jgi:glycosyltransferase involved in cell wall biosynthesis
MIKTKPIVWFYHNHSQYGTVQRCKERLIVVYNSQAAKDANQYPNNYSLVLAPPVDIDYYDVPRGNDGAITLINLNERKGGPIFWKLAAELPEYKFLGVKGSYGQQWDGDRLPNVEIMEPQTDMREVYKRTDILIMPSDYESWGRTATEAAASGIPVISTDTPGLRENMGEAGIYIDKRRFYEWVAMIKKLKGKKEYAEQSAKVRARAQEHRPNSKLEIFEEEICRIAKKPKPAQKQEYEN